MTLLRAPDGTEFTDRAEYRKYLFLTQYTFKDRESEILQKLPGEIDGQPFDLTSLNRCEVALLDRSEAVQVDDLTDCRVFIAACVDSVFVRNCVGCVFTVACKQLRTRDCTDCEFRLYCKTEPIIETSTRLAFGQFNGAYNEHAEHLRAANLTTPNLWFGVYDFNDKAKTGKNWRLIDDEEEQGDEPWRPLDDGAEIAVLRTAPGSLTLPSQKTGGFGTGASNVNGTGWAVGGGCGGAAARAGGGGGGATMGFSFSTSASEAAAIVKQGESGVGKSEPRAVSHLERVERGHGGGGVGRRRGSGVAGPRPQPSISAPTAATYARPSSEGVAAGRTLPTCREEATATTSRQLPDAVIPVGGVSSGKPKVGWDPSRCSLVASLEPVSATCAAVSGGASFATLERASRSSSSYSSSTSFDSSASPSPRLPSEAAAIRAGNKTTLRTLLAEGQGRGRTSRRYRKDRVARVKASEATRVDWKPDCAGGASIATTVSITPETQQPAVLCSSATAGAVMATTRGACKAISATTGPTAAAAGQGGASAALERSSRTSQPRPKIGEWSFSCAAGASPSTPISVGRAGGGASSPPCSMWRREEEVRLHNDGGDSDCRGSRGGGGASEPQETPAPPSPTGDEEEPTGRRQRVGWDSVRAAQALKACKAWRDSPLSTEVEGDVGVTPTADPVPTITAATAAADAASAAALSTLATAPVDTSATAGAFEPRGGRPKTGSSVGWNASRVGNPAVPAPVQHMVMAAAAVSEPRGGRPKTSSSVGWNASRVGNPTVPAPIQHVVAVTGAAEAEVAAGRDAARGAAVEKRGVVGKGAGGGSAQGEVPLQLRAVLLYASAQRGINLRKWFDLGGAGEGGNDGEEAVYVFFCREFSQFELILTGLTEGLKVGGALAVTTSSHVVDVGTLLGLCGIPSVLDGTERRDGGEGGGETHCTPGVRRRERRQPNRGGAGGEESVEEIGRERGRARVVAGEGRGAARAPLTPEAAAVAEAVADEDALRRVTHQADLYGRLSASLGLRQPYGCSSPAARAEWEASLKRSTVSLRAFRKALGEAGLVLGRTRAMALATRACGPLAPPPTSPVTRRPRNGRGRRPGVATAPTTALVPVNANASANTRTTTTTASNGKAVGGDVGGGSGGRGEGRSGIGVGVRGDRRRRRRRERHQNNLALPAWELRTYLLRLRVEPKSQATRDQRRDRFLFLTGRGGREDGAGERWGEEARAVADDDDGPLRPADFATWGKRVRGERIEREKERKREFQRMLAGHAHSLSRQDLEECVCNYEIMPPEVMSRELRAMGKAFSESMEGRRRARELLRLWSKPSPAVRNACGPGDPEQETWEHAQAFSIAQRKSRAREIVAKERQEELAESEQASASVSRGIFLAYMRSAGGGGEAGAGAGTGGGMSLQRWLEDRQAAVKKVATNMVD
eukprot:jgi/Undpi1/2099/HiC_scaffold_12.g05485.m1